MSSAVSAFYEPLIERRLDAIEAAAHVFLAKQSEEELWTAVARFAVLAYAPSQHAKRAVMAARAAYELRAQLGAEWVPMLVACARYAAESRPPWSEPPILDPPHVDEQSRRGLSELREAMATSDRLRGERWLSAHLEDAESLLRHEVRGDALLMLDTAAALEPLLGAKGRFALLRMPVAELFEPQEPPAEEPLETLIELAIAAEGAVDAVRSVFVAAAGRPGAGAPPAAPPLPPYHLARDYAQTLIAHAMAPRLPARASEFLQAVHHNLDHGDSFADFSFA
jgi:hypothetical protein